MAVNPVKTPFGNMSFTPDVPPQALTANEYNSGYNVESDVRGVRCVNGDENILSQVPGHTIFVTAGFRTGTNYWFIVATQEGYWYGINAAGITNLTPPNGPYSYTNTTNITDSWNGDVLFINDTVNPPMYLLPTETAFRLYDTSYGSQTPNTYIWNYNPNWSTLTAGFVRLFASPNVGSLLIAGNLTANVIASGTTTNFPNTVRWSQNFGQNAGPTTWAPTATNVANELEIPVRGPVVDGFPLNGNFYVCSYWDTVVFSPIAFQNTQTPVFGIKLVNQGRGLLNENCWSNADNNVYGLDARDIWVFDGGNFKSLGNQRVKNYFYSNLNSTYADRVFMVNNTSKNQIEIYYPNLTSTGWCNQMLGYRYDLDVWNPPRTISNGTHAVESPIWTGNTYNLATRTVVYSRGTTANVQLVQKDMGTAFLGNTTISSQFRRDSIMFGQPYSKKIQVHRVLPEVIGTGNIDVTVGGADSTGANITFKPTVTLPISTDNPWCQIDQNDVRVVTVEFGSNTTTSTWNVSAMNWQINIIEDSY